MWCTRSMWRSPTAQLGSRRSRFLRAARVTQRHPETGLELRHAERLGHEVVGTAVERLDLAPLVAVGRQHHDGNVGDSRMLRQTLMPSTSGRPRSRITRSGPPRATWVIASAPVSAVTTSSPRAAARCASAFNRRGRRRRRDLGQAQASGSRRTKASPGTVKTTRAPGSTSGSIQIAPRGPRRKPWRWPARARPDPRRRSG